LFTPCRESLTLPFTHQSSDDLSKDKSPEENFKEEKNHGKHDGKKAEGPRGANHLFGRQALPSLGIDLTTSGPGQLLQ
jgi:hypothetical protein